MAKLRLESLRFWLAFITGLLLPLLGYEVAIAQSSNEVTQNAAIGLFVTTLLLGMRHGIDWDHLAAITDIAGSAAAQEMPLVLATSTAAIAVPASSQVQQGMKLSAAYAGGHGFMVILLGLLAITIRAILPDWIDPWMSSVVGLTLILLGLALLASIWRDGKQYKLRSRWMVVIHAVRYARNWLQAKLTRSPMIIPKQNNRYNLLGAFCIGLLHGIGAETGTQVTLLISVAGINSLGLSLILLLTFSGGMLFSSMLVGLLISSGFVNLQNNRLLYLTLGLSASLFSLVIGVVFLLQRDNILPDMQTLFSFIH